MYDKIHYKLKKNNNKSKKKNKIRSILYSKKKKKKICILVPDQHFWCCSIPFFWFLLLDQCEGSSLTSLFSYKDLAAPLKGAELEETLLTPFSIS